MPVSVNTILYVQYSFEAIEQEARQLVEKGVVSRSQHIYSLCEYIPVREWICFERELEAHELLLRDRVGDLLGREEWEND